MHPFLVRLDFGSLVCHAFALLIDCRPLAPLRRFGRFVQVGELAAVAFLLLVHVVRANARHEVGPVAVHIEERFEAVLLAGIQKPVDGALLIGLAMVGEELLEEVLPDGVARRALGSGGECICHVAQVLLKGLRAVRRYQELLEARHDVVREIRVIRDRQHVVRIWHEGDVLRVGHLGEVVLHGAALVGQHEPVYVERVAAEHATHGVADEAHDLVAARAHVLVALVAFGNLLLGVEDSRDRDVLVLDLDGHLAHHAVDLGEDAVKLLLVGAELLEPLVDLGLVCLVFVSYEGCHTTPPFVMWKMGLLRAQNSQLDCRVCQAQCGVRICQTYEQMFDIVGISW